jgi:hypothetical protein
MRKPWLCGLPGREELITPAMVYDWIDPNTIARKGYAAGGANVNH